MKRPQDHDLYLTLRFFHVDLSLFIIFVNSTVILKQSQSHDLSVWSSNNLLQRVIWAGKVKIRAGDGKVKKNPTQNWKKIMPEI